MSKNKHFGKEIAAFALKKIKALRNDITKTYVPIMSDKIVSMKEWNMVLDMIIYSLECTVDHDFDSDGRIMTGAQITERRERIDQGLVLFGYYLRYFMAKL